MLGFDDRPQRALDGSPQIPGQTESLTRGGQGGTQVLELQEAATDVDYLSVSDEHTHTRLLLNHAQAPADACARLQELIAMQQGGPREIGFFGTRNMGYAHQGLIEVLSYAMVLTVRLQLESAAETCCVLSY